MSGHTPTGRPEIPFDACQCPVWHEPQWTQWQPSMFAALTDTRYCRRCGYRVYRMRMERP